MVRALTRPSVVLATREVWPFVLGGGIGRHVSEVARLLAPHADVTILTSDAFREQHDELRAAGDPRLPDDVRFGWVAAPQGEGDGRPVWSVFHAWSLAFWDAVQAVARERHVDLVEFEDYGGAGAVTADAKRAGAPELAETTIAVRLHSSWEMIAELDRLPKDSLDVRSLMALERVSLRFADVLLHPSERTLTAYRRFYGADALAPVRRVPVSLVLPPVVDVPPPPDPPLRLLHLGRLQAIKGVAGLIEAFSSLDDPRLELTFVGRDTRTGPAQRSMREHVEAIAAGDARVRFAEQVPPEAVPALIAEHHVVVVPSRFESFGYVVREANAANRPVLATPVGAIPDGFVEGRSGWLTSDATTQALRQGLVDLVERREEIAQLIAEGAPRAAVEAASDMGGLVDAYLALATSAGAAPEGARGASGPPPRMSAVVSVGPGDGSLPRMSAVVSVGPGDGSLQATLASLHAQVPPLHEIVLAGTAEDIPPAAVAGADRVVFVARSLSQRAIGWWRGLAGMPDDEGVALLRAGDVLRPGFCAAAAAGLASSAAPAYVTTYAESGGPTSAPLGNSVAGLFAEVDVSASIAALRVADAKEALGALAGVACTERVLLAHLAERGRYGAVIPAVLVEQRSPRGGPPRQVSAELGGARAAAWASG